MSRPRLERFAAALLVPIVLLPHGARGQAPGSTSPSLVPATFGRNTQDALGFQWDVVENGSIRSGTNRCFQNAGVLTVNGSNASATQNMMTPDGAE